MSAATGSTVAAARAQAAVGTRFRLHGRGSDGLDCVGLAALAYDVAVPTGYSLRSQDLVAVDRFVVDAGLVSVADMRAGDLIAMASGPGQLHLGIATDLGFVHADASLRRVVERPGAPPWPVLARWRKGD